MCGGGGGGERGRVGGTYTHFIRLSHFIAYYTAGKSDSYIVSSHMPQHCGHTNISKNGYRTVIKDIPTTSHSFN